MAWLEILDNSLWTILINPIWRIYNGKMFVQMDPFRLAHSTVYLLIVCPGHKVQVICSLRFLLLNCFYFIVLDQWIPWNWVDNLVWQKYILGSVFAYQKCQTGKTSMYSVQWLSPNVPTIQIAVVTHSFNCFNHWPGGRGELGEKRYELLKMATFCCTCGLHNIYLFVCSVIFMLKRTP